MQTYPASLPPPTLAGVVLIVIAAIWPLYMSTRARAIQRPPGPRGIPFFGNTFQVPFTHLATYLKELHSRHGGLVYMYINRQHVFSIGDIELATELLDRRSGLYSSRPTIPFYERYLDPDGTIWALAKPGESHFWGRKIGTTIMKHVRTGHSEPLQRLEAVALMNNIIDNKGESWYEEIDRMNASTNVAAIYGVRSIDSEPPEVKKVLELTHNMTVVGNPFFTVINLFPFIDDLIPAFVPTAWRTAAKTWRKQDTEGWEELFLEALEGKGAQMSTWARMFADESKDKRQLLGLFSAAAIETTATAMKSFVLACVVYPEWIEAAQDELDRVVGPDRLPSFEDRPLLPFIEAVVREVLRWNPPFRNGLPHATTADDVIEYQGKEYFIPKGSMIHCAAYVMEHDENQYTSPLIFWPQRFLDDKGQLKADYRTTSFGFGRRLCVGIPFAERSLWVVFATLLWTFNIRKKIDPLTGSPFNYNLKDDAFNGGATNAPLPFPATFEPRDDNRISVARREWEESEKDLNILLPPLKR